MRLVKTVQGIVAVALLAAAGANALAQDFKAKLVQSGVITVATSGSAPPFSMTDASGKLDGFDIDVMNEIGRRLGVKVEYVETPWDSMFAALQAKRFDLVANQVTWNAERAALYDLSDPYVETTGVVLAEPMPPGRSEGPRDHRAKQPSRQSQHGSAGQRRAACGSS